MHNSSRIKKQLEFFKNVKRKEILQELIEASELGDLFRENHAFDVAVAKQRINERRIVELEELSNHILHQRKFLDIGIGSKVLIEFSLPTKNFLSVTVVSPEQKELDDSDNLISTESPLGKAILWKRKGQKFSYVAPNGKLRTGKIISIE